MRYCKADSDLFGLQGDSGGPLTYKQGPQHVLIGVTSHGTGEGTKKCGDNSGFCRVSEVREWIDKVVVYNGAKFCDQGFEAEGN